MLTKNEIDALVNASRAADEGPTLLVRRVETAVREHCAKIAERRGMAHHLGICREIGAEIRGADAGGPLALNVTGAATGECFEPGQVWMTATGTLWAVVGYASRQGKPKQAVLRRGMDGLKGLGRKKERDWDAVQGWVIYQHVDGRLAYPAAQ